MISCFELAVVSWNAFKRNTQVFEEITGILYANG